MSALEARVIHRFQSTTARIALVVVGLGYLVLIGWLLDIEVIKSIIPGLTAMNPMSAVLFMLGGLTLLFYTTHARRLALICALLIITLAVLKLVDVVFNLNIPVDQLLFADKLAASTVPNRIAPNSALSFALIGVALILANTPTLRASKLTQGFTLLAMLIAFLALIGYGYGVQPFYGVLTYIPMAINSSVLFLILGSGILSFQPNSGFMAIWRSPTTGGTVARRLLPAAIFVPTLLGWLRLLGEQAGLYSAPFGTALNATADVLVLFGMVAWTANLIYKSDGARKKSDLALDEIGARYRNMFQHSSDAILVFNDQGKYLDANPRAESLTGYSHDEILNLKVGDMTPRRQVDAAPQRFAATTGQGNWSGEGLVLRKDGSEISVEISAVAVAPGLYQTILHDINERKQAEEAIRESEARFHALFERSSDAIILMNEEGRYIDANPHAARLTGYTHEELLKMKVGDLSSEHLAPYGRETFEAFKLNRRANEYVLTHKDGSPIMVETTIIQVAPTLYQTIMHEIGERKKVEESLRTALAQQKELNELKARFVSMVSHEFRTPLSIIQSSTDLIINYDNRMEPAKRAERLEKVQIQVTRLVELLDDILTISRAEAMGVNFKPELIDLKAFCESLVREVQAASPRHRLIFTCADDSVPANVDTTLMRRALMNLISNAVKYSPEGDRALIDLQRDEGEVEVIVRDYGIGIPKEDQEHLFDLFQRARNVGSISGTGLGLPIVKQAIEAHGGTISVESQENVGTTFVIHLPQKSA